MNFLCRLLLASLLLTLVSLDFAYAQDPTTLSGWKEQYKERRNSQTEATDPRTGDKIPVIPPTTPGGQPTITDRKLLFQGLN